MVSFVRLCEIVEFAHAKGVVHRDIKPDNVMLGSYGEVYLLDWGLALALTDEAAAHLPRAADASDMAGTLHYASPEMVGLLDHRMDVRRFCSSRSRAPARDAQPTLPICWAHVAP